MDTVKAKVGSLFSVNLSLIAIFFFLFFVGGEGGVDGDTHGNVVKGHVPGNYCM